MIANHRVAEVVSRLTGVPRDELMRGIPPKLPLFCSADSLDTIELIMELEEEDVLRAVRSLPEDIWEATPDQFHVGSDGLVLFDSAYSGDDLPSTCDDGANVPWMILPVPMGTYEVDTADYRPDDSTRLILHRLRRTRSKSG